MKRILFIAGLLMGILLFAPEIGTGGECAPIAPQDTRMDETGAADTQRHFEVLSQDLKDSHFLIPRRVFQSNSPTSDFRSSKTVEKLSQASRLRGTNELHKVSQHISTNRIACLSTHLRREGLHVFALRKIII